MTRVLKNIAITFLLLVLVIFILQKTNVLPSWKEIFAPKKIQVEETAMIVRQVKNIAQLMTVETYDEVIADSSKTNALSIVTQVFKNNPLAPLPFLAIPHVVLIMKGRVIAGIDLQQMQASAIHIHKDSISLQLPKAKILDVITNPSDVETFSEKGTWAPEEITLVKQKGKVIIVQHALQQDVLQKSETKATELITNLLQSSGYKKVTINYAN